jgi:hypothetical protein
MVFRDYLGWMCVRPKCLQPLGMQLGTQWYLRVNSLVSFILLALR